MAIPFPTVAERRLSPQVIEAIRLSEAGFDAGVDDLPDDPSKAEPWHRGWVRGVSFRRVARGEALGFAGQGSKCRRCGTVHWGLRSSCCGKAVVDHGVLIKNAQTGDGPAVFMTGHKLRQAKMPLIDLSTGDEIPLEQGRSAA